MGVSLIFISLIVMVGLLVYKVIWFYFLKNKVDIFSRFCSSVLLKSFFLSESISNTATSLSLLNMGTTISDFVSESHDI
jgi:hypothetical protein